MQKHFPNLGIGKVQSAGVKWWKWHSVKNTFRGPDVPEAGNSSLQWSFNYLILSWKEQS